jgi:ribosomal protein L28
VTKNLADLCSAASAVGYTVSTSDSGILIYKTVRVNKTATKKVGLWVAPNGTALDLSVDLSVVKGIRSYKEMRKILKIA